MCDEFERNHFFKANLRQIQCYSELKEKNNTHVCFDVVMCAVGHHHPPYVILSGFTDGNLTLGVEIATSNLERREKFVHPALRTGATILQRLMILEHTPRIFQTSV